MSFFCRLHVAFAGSRQFKGLHNADRAGRAKVPTVQPGRQQLLPSGWPLPTACQVWVLPSTSGACPMSNEAREGPWLRLGEELRRHEWPRSAAWRPPCVVAAAAKGAADAAPVGGEG